MCLCANGGVWSQQAYLKASNTDVRDWFSYSSVAISGDTVVVGAFLEDSSAIGVNGNEGDNSASQAGAAYVFVRNGGVWSQQAYLKASNTEASECFGKSAAISGDTVVVGALYESSSATGVNGNEGDNSASQAGAAYVFSVEPGPGPPRPRITSGGVVVGNLLPTISSISPNSIISIFGSEFAPEGFSDTDTQTDAAGLVATNQSGVCVEIGGVRAPMFHVFPNQLNVQAPSIEGESPASVVVVTGCDTPEEQRSAAESVSLVALTPAFFVTDFVDGGGANPIAALHPGRSRNRGRSGYPAGFYAGRPGRIHQLVPGPGLVRRILRYKQGPFPEAWRASPGNSR